MKIGVIADTHIPIQAKEIPDTILQDFKNVDMIVHAGDLVDLSVLDQLKTVCKEVRAVCGNMDSYEARKELPQKQFIMTAKHKIGIMHGAGPANDLIKFMLEAFKGDGVDMVIFGHSHRALEEVKDGVLYFNPGSPTDKIVADYNSYGIIEINDKIEPKIIKI